MLPSRAWSRELGTWPCASQRRETAAWPWAQEDTENGFHWALRGLHWGRPDWLPESPAILLPTAEHTLALSEHVRPRHWLPFQITAQETCGKGSPLQSPLRVLTVQFGDINCKTSHMHSPTAPGTPPSPFLKQQWTRTGKPQHTLPRGKGKNGNTRKSLVHRGGQILLARTVRTEDAHLANLLLEDSVSPSSSVATSEAGVK